MVGPSTLVETAKSFALKWHHGQFRRDGVTPYSVHLEAVAAAVQTDEAKAVAWLHDVVENTEAPIHELYSTFPKEVANAVIILTHDEYTSYKNYIIEVAKTPLARQVKIADIKHNLSDAPTEHQIKKYHAALKFLESP